MMAKPIKTLELHYPMIQFLIIIIIIIMTIIIIVIFSSQVILDKFWEHIFCALVQDTCQNCLW